MSSGTSEVVEPALGRTVAPEGGRSVCAGESLARLGGQVIEMSPAFPSENGGQMVSAEGHRWIAQQRHGQRAIR
jgi:hypothetical protein